MQPSDTARLIRILSLLGSEHDGERAAAAIAAHRLVRRSGQSWQQLLQPRQPATAAASSIRPQRDDRTDLLQATASRLRQAQRENTDLRKQIAQLRRRLEAQSAELSQSAQERWPVRDQSRR